MDPKHTNFPQTLSQDTNRRISTLRKSMLHQILQYNIQSSSQRKNYMKSLHDQTQKQVNNLIQQQLYTIKRDRQQSRLNVMQRRQMLKEQYQREIREKELRKMKEKADDIVYARLENQYQEYSNQRRIYDIQRMYNRRSYKASIDDNAVNGANYYTNQDRQSYRNNRLKTQPTNANPQLYSSPNLNPTPNNNNKYQNIQNNTASTPKYRDSLDNIQMPSIQKTPSSYINPKPPLKMQNYGSNYRLDYN